jgi:hypothetical protein
MWDVGMLNPPKMKQFKGENMNHQHGHTMPRSNGCHGTNFCLLTRTFAHSEAAPFHADSQPAAEHTSHASCDMIWLGGHSSLGGHACNLVIDYFSGLVTDLACKYLSIHNPLQFDEQRRTRGHRIGLSPSGNRASLLCMPNRKPKSCAQGNSKTYLSLPHTCHERISDCSMGARSSKHPACWKARSTDKTSI